MKGLFLFAVALLLAGAMLVFVNVSKDNVVDGIVNEASDISNTDTQDTNTQDTEIQDTGTINASNDDSKNGNLVGSSNKDRNDKNIFGLYCSYPFIKSEKGCCLDENRDNECDKLKEKKSHGGNSNLEFGGVCGDGICNENEIKSCCFDCGCKRGYFCSIDKKCYPLKSINDSEDNSEVNKSGNAYMRNNPDEIPENITFASLIKDNIYVKYPPYCGDGVCDENESSTCCNDCGCSLGICNELTHKCGIKLAPLAEINNTLRLSYDEYLLIVVTHINPVENLDGYKCPSYDPLCTTEDYYNEFMFYSRAMIGDDVQKVIFPMGRPTKTPVMKNVIAYGSEVPVFAMNKEYLDDNDIHLQLFLAESDKNTNLFKFNYDNVDNNLNKFYEGNDNIGTVDALFKPPYISSGSYFLGQAFVDVDSYMVKVYDNIKLKVYLNDIILEEGGDGRYEDSELVYWYRVADDIVADEYGIDYQYNTRQSAGGEYLGEVPENPMGSVAINKEIFSTDSLGPFLYIEVELIDLDSDCVTLPNNPFPCSGARKSDVLYAGSLLLMADNYYLLEHPYDTIELDYNMPMVGRGLNYVRVRIVREPLVTS